MGISVGFDYQAWRARYPEFNDTVPQDMAQQFFNEATLYHRNDGSGPVAKPLAQSIYLNMLTAHIAQLYVGTNAEPASSLVGVVNSASEGSVSVGVELDANGSPTQAWFMQTKYGASYWAATTAYRSMRYMPGPRHVVNPFFRLR